jgi:hypothetical protein
VGSKFLPKMLGFLQRISVNLGLLTKIVGASSLSQSLQEWLVTGYELLQFSLDFRPFWHRRRRFGRGDDNALMLRVGHNVDLIADT